MSAFNRWWSSQHNHDADSKEFARRVWQAAIASVAAPIPPTPSQQEALDALENMDDYARMAGVSPDGAYTTLNNYILARPDAPTGWQPIETAPNDDTTKMLALLKSGRVVTARGFFQCILGPKKIGGGSETIGSKFSGYVEDKGDAWMPITPTHWMPPPARPEGEKK